MKKFKKLENIVEIMWLNCFSAIDSPIAENIVLFEKEKHLQIIEFETELAAPQNSINELLPVINVYCTKRCVTFLRDKDSQSTYSQTMYLIHLQNSVIYNLFSHNIDFTAAFMAMKVPLLYIKS